MKKLILFIAVLVLGGTAPLFTQEAVHEVQKGETLYGLSRKYGVTVQELVEANHLTSAESVRSGTRLIIPVKKDLRIAENQQYNGKSTHTVAKGETLYGISRQYGMSVDELLSLNGLPPGAVLKPGQTLAVSGEKSGGSVTKTTVSRPSGTITEDMVPFWPAAGSREDLSGKFVGVRIAAGSSSWIRSVSPGTVVWIGPYRGFENVVLVHWDNHIYLYGGNEDIFVNVGEKIQTGSRIGRTGMDRKDVFFSVFRDGKAVEADKAPRGR